jgi:hypothetical protein
MNGGPSLTIFELFRGVRSWQEFRTLELSLLITTNFSG